MLTSQLCKQAAFTTPSFVEWAERLRPTWDGEGTRRPVRLHRKIWEWVFIAQALEEAGMLAPGRRGLGFGVGREPLAALFASFGCDIVATDQSATRAESTGWVQSSEYAGALAGLNEHGLCSPEAFSRRVTFRVVDMNAIPPDLTGFDFTWSSCAFEHLGSIPDGLAFVLQQMRCLRPRGLAVHTTELNVSSLDSTISSGPTVLFRQRDLTAVSRRLRALGDHVQCDFSDGEGPADLHVDSPPYRGDSEPHLRLRYEDHVTTSFALVVERAARPWRRRVSEMVPPRAKRLLVSLTTP